MQLENVMAHGRLIETVNNHVLSHAKDCLAGKAYQCLAVLRCFPCLESHPMTSLHFTSCQASTLIDSSFNYD